MNSYNNNNNSNDEFSWMSDQIKSKNTTNKVPTKKSPRSMNNMTNNNNLTGSAFIEHANKNKNAYNAPNEFLSGIPMSKRAPPTIPSNEFNFGIPMSKSLPPTSLYSNARSPYELNTGIPPQKNPSAINPFNEFLSGVPMSKSGIPINPSSYRSPLPSSAFTPDKIADTIKRHPMAKLDPRAASFQPSSAPNPDSQVRFIPPNEIEKSEYPSYDTVISINDILKRDKKVLNTLRLCLEARGWCKITYPEKTNKVIKSVMDNVHKWFISADLNEKLKYSRKSKDGKVNPQSEYSYNRIPGFKEGLRILTGDIYKVHYQNNKYPGNVIICFLFFFVEL